MSLNENLSSPPFQPHPPLPMSRPHSPLAPSSIFGISHHARPDWTTLLTVPIPTRIFAVGYSSLAPDASGCIEAMEIRICSGPSGTSYYPTASESVVIVPPESSTKVTIGGGEPSTRTATTPSSSAHNPSSNPALGSTSQPQLSPSAPPPPPSTTTFQTLPSTSTSPSTSPSNIPSQGNPTTDITAPPSPMTTTDLSGQPEAFQSGQHGPIAVYIILCVFVTFGIVCAIVTNRRFVAWTHAAIRKRNERIERADRAERAKAALSVER